MERLTKYEVVGGHVHAVPTGDVDQAMMRLAAYEDTGLTPERCAEFAREDAEGRYIVMRDREQTLEKNMLVMYMEKPKHDCTKFGNQ